MAMVTRTNKKGNKKSNYFQEVNKELKKVTYPTFSTVRKNTLIVIMLSIIVGIFIAALDYGFRSGETAIFDTHAATSVTSAPSATSPGGLVYDDNGNVTGYYDQNGNVVPINMTSDDGGDGAATAPADGGQ